MFNIGPLELIVILVIALLVVGPKRLPEVGRSIGRGLKEFRRAQDEVRRSLRFDFDEEPEQPAHGPAPKAAEPGLASNGEVSGGPAADTSADPPDATSAGAE